MHIRRRQIWLTAALVLLLALAGVLAVHAISIGRHVRAAEEPIRPWMSVPYIAHYKHVPPGTLWTALGLTPHLHDHRPLGRIARQVKRPISDLIAKIEAAVARGPKRDTPAVPEPRVAR